MDGVFVGRRRELAELGRRRSDAAEGRGGVVLVVGEAGIGKSALVERLIGDFGADGVPVLVGRAVLDEGMPAFWPWIRLLGAPAGAAHGLGQELLAVGRPAAFALAAAARFEMIDRTARALVVAATERGLLVVLEDLQWADEASLQLLRYLAGELPGSRLLLVGTFRDEGVPPLLTDVGGLGGVQLLRLRPLGVEEVAEYLSWVGAGEVHPSWPARVHRYSGGNALFVRELAQVLITERLLAAPAVELPVPVQLRRLVSHRLDGLSESCRRLLAGCAVYGEEVNVRVLEAEPEPLAEAVAAGVLVEDVAAPDRLRWSHALVRAAYYEDIPRAERLAWHRRLAEALATSGGKGRAVDSARHWLRVAVDQPSRRAAIAACGHAAQEAGDLLAFDDVAYWHGQALGLIEDDTERCQTLLALADAAYRGGQVAEALDWCAGAADLAEWLDRPDLLADAAIVVQGIGGPHATTVAQLCVRARDRLGEEDSARHARVLAQHALTMTINDIADADPVSRRALEMAERSGETDAIIDAVHARHQVVGGPDSVEERLSLGNRLREIAGTQDRPIAALWGHTWRIDAAFQLGAIQTVSSELVELEGLADRVGWPLARWHLLRGHASLALLAGRFDEAERLAESFRKIADRTQDLSAQGAFFVFHSLLWRRTGRPGDIREVLASLPESYVALAERIPVLMSVSAMLHLDGGDRDHAAVLFEGLRASIDGLPVNQRWTMIVTSTGELAAAFGDRDTAALCYRLLLPYGGYYDNQAAGCNGAVARTLGTLAAATDRLDDADRHFSTAATMERRIAALPHRALAQLAHAQALMSRGASGDRARALDLAEQAALTARRLGMAPAARAAAQLADELAGVRGGPVTLTRREHEITGLVATGLANREIAERLVVSERTVETHVSHVLGKLGLANRTQLTAWALRAGIRT
ncbi:AAA family ATPase [Nonomuraea sp. M3C6]|uniref:AAA family ATPase n=1 Tax=Nonomuraea marmarensis TaxID=3351344 RepID=A0ABW7AJ32_9ACTN